MAHSKVASSPTLRLQCYMKSKRKHRWLETSLKVYCSLRIFCTSWFYLQKQKKDCGSSTLMTLLPQKINDTFLQQFQQFTRNCYFQCFWILKETYTQSEKTIWKWKHLSSTLIPTSCFWAEQLSIGRRGFGFEHLNMS